MNRCAGFDAYVLIDNEYVPKSNVSLDYSQAEQLLAQQKAGMLVQGNWAVNEFKTMDLPFEIGVFPLPYNAPGEETATSFVPGLFLSISATSKHQEEAKKFLEFLSDKDSGAPLYYNSIGHIPTVQGVTSSEPLAQLWDPIIAGNGYSSLRNDLNQATLDSLNKGLQEMLVGATAEQVAQDVQAELDKSLQLSAK